LRLSHLLVHGFKVDPTTSWSDLGMAANAFLVENELVLKLAEEISIEQDVNSSGVTDTIDHYLKKTEYEVCGPKLIRTQS
jgi:hypothetical protein